MKEHHCTRFKQTGSMQLMVAHIEITRDGQKTEESISTDTVQLKCIRCGATQWVDRTRVEANGKYLGLKEGEDLGAR